jgi:hypothetical protein
MVLTMGIITLLAYLCIALLLMNMLAKVRPYRRAEKPGRAIAMSGMTLWQRIRFHRSSLLALGTAVVFGSATHWLPGSIAAMVAAFAIVLVLMPMRFTLTTAGLAIGEAEFLPWKDIRDANMEGSRLAVGFGSNTGRFTLTLSPAEMSSVWLHIRK